MSEANEGLSKANEGRSEAKIRAALPARRWSQGRYLRRKLTNVVALSLSGVAMLLGLAGLCWILGTLISHGAGALSAAVFTQNTPPPGGTGGLLNAIVGSLLMTGVATLIGTPLGILAGTFLAERSTQGVMASVTRFVVGIFLSSPSIVIGFFVYTLMVAPLGHFSGWGGIVALTLILVPLVAAQTENMLRLVPNSLREAAAALGAPKWKVTVQVTYRSARAGILTGILLGVARISGETAPLLFTALNNQFFSVDLARPMANLPIVIFQFAMSPYEDWQRLAWAGALLIATTVLLLNILARLGVARLKKKGSSA